MANGNGGPFDFGGQWSLGIDREFGLGEFADPDAPLEFADPWGFEPAPGELRTSGIFGDMGDVGLRDWTADWMAADLAGPGGDFGPLPDRADAFALQTDWDNPLWASLGFDTETGAVVDLQTGAPLSDADLEALAGSIEGDFAGGAAPLAEGEPPVAPPAAFAYTLGGQPLSREQAMALGGEWEAAYEAAGFRPPVAAGGAAAPESTLGRINAFLGSPLGGLLGAAGIGALGLGATRAFAGRPPRLELPPFVPSPTTRAEQEAVLAAFGGPRPIGPQLTEILQTATGGQLDVARQLAARAEREGLAEAEQAPAERAFRLQALGMAPGLLQAPGADPIEAALQAELLTVLGGEGVSPATARRHAFEVAAARARLQSQLGLGWETSTPGIQALNELAQRHSAERFFERQQTIRGLAPLEESRRAGTFARRRASLGDVTALSRFGLTGVPETLTGLRGLAPASAFLGGDPEEANRINAELASRMALAGFQAQSADRAALAQGIGQLTGTLAGGVLNRPSEFERALADMIRRQTGSA